MKNKKSSHIGIWLVIAIIAVISYIAFKEVIRNGITITSNSRDESSNIESIENLKDKVDFPLDIPSFVTETKEELNINLIAGQIVCINTDKMVLKASPFIDIEADALGLYEESELSEAYSVKKSDIIYFKYRQGYKDYPNCTIINWCTNETSYGIMIEDNISLDRALGIIGIDRDNISIYSEMTETNNNTTTEYIIDDLITIKLPKFNNSVYHIDTNGVSAFFSGDILLFIVVYNKKDIQEGTYSEQSVIDVSDDIKIYYDKNNSYDQGSDAYNDYELMLSSIDNIGETIMYK